MVIKIQALNPIAPQGLAQLSIDHYTIGETITAPDALILRSHDLNQSTIPESVRAVSRAGAGVNNIPVEQLTARGIPVFNTPGANANAVKELVITGMLIASRNIFKSWNFLKALPNSKEDMHTYVETHKKQFTGFELFGKTLSIMGLGSIGTRLANAACALGMKVIGYDPYMTRENALKMDHHVTYTHDLNRVLREADFLSLHIPLTAETKNMISHEMLNKIKTGAVLLNFSRDGIINNVALKTVLDDGHLHAYVSDFPTPELIHHERVIALPHLGASTNEAQLNCAIMAVKHLKNFFELGHIQHSVNFPEIRLGTIRGYRVGLFNQNKLNMVGQITAVLAHANYNIIDMVNKSQDDMAYTLIDVDKPLDMQTISTLENIKGIVRVTQINPN